MSVNNIFDIDTLPAASDSEARILHLLELDVFKSYSLGSEWWANPAAYLPENAAGAGLAKKLFDVVGDYDLLAKNAPGAPTVPQVIKSLEEIAQDPDLATLPPIATILTYNYLGLTQRRLPPVNEAGETVPKMEMAAKSFSAAMMAALRHNGVVPGLWPGYILFNLARTFKQSDRPDWNQSVWRKGMTSAVVLRSAWLDLPEKIPATVRQSLAAEYYHARATAIDFDYDKAAGKQQEISVEEIRDAYNNYASFCDNLPMGPTSSIVAGLGKVWDAIATRNGIDLIPARSPDSSGAEVAPGEKPCGPQG